jgi:hypothetical protein
MYILGSFVFPSWTIRVFMLAISLLCHIKDLNWSDSTGPGLSQEGERAGNT